MFNIFLKVLFNKLILDLLISQSWFISCCFSCNYKAYCISYSKQFPPLLCYSVSSLGISFAVFPTPVVLSSVPGIWNLGWGVVEQNPGQRCLGEPEGLSRPGLHVIYLGLLPVILFTPVPVPLLAPSQAVPQCLKVSQGRESSAHSIKDMWLAAVAPFFHKRIIGSVHC